MWWLLLIWPVSGCLCFCFAVREFRAGDWDLYLLGCIAGALLGPIGLYWIYDEWC